MIIGIDASRANQSAKTGTEWYSQVLLEQFAKLDQTNQYKLYVKNPPNPDLFKFGENFEVKPLKWPISRFWHQGRISLEMLFKQPDVLFVPAHTIPLIHPTNTVTTCHDIGFVHFPELYSKSELSYHRWSMQQAIKKAKKIITVSNFTKEEIVKVYKTDPTRIEVIHHGIDLEYFSPRNESEIEQVKNRYKISQPYLFFIGRIEKKKNIINQIKAFEIAKEKYNISHQLVLGGNPGFGFEEINKAITESKFKKDIKLIGYVESADLPTLYSGADLFLFVTNYEGFGMPVLEAQACQTAVIGSDVCSIPEVGGQGISLVSPDHLTEIAEAIHQVISNKNFQEQLISKGLTNCSQFSWSVTAQRTLDILLKI